MLRLNTEDSELQKKITVGSNDEILIELNEDKDSETDINRLSDCVYIKFYYY